MINYENYSFLKKFTPLSYDEQMDLMIKIKSGDMKAREEFIKSNLRLVFSIAKNYNRNDVDFDDIFGYGVTGLINAVEKYDISSGTAFSTYAFKSIIRTINRELNTIIKLPENLKDVYSKYLQLIRNSSDNLSDEQIMDILDISESILSKLQQYQNSSVVSLESSINGSDDERLNLANIIPDKSNQYDNLESNIDLDILLYKLKQGLSNYEYYIIYSRYLIPKCKNLQILSDELCVTRERVRQKEASALKKIKEIYSKSITAKISKREKLIPLSLKQIIILYNVRSICTDVEYFIFYNIFLNIFSLKELSNRLTICEDEIKQMYDSIIRNFRNTFKSYDTIKDKMLAKYLVSQIMEFNVEPTINYDYSSVLKFLNTISYEEILECSSFYETLDEYHKKLIYKYYNVENIEHTKRQLHVAQKEINLTLMGYNKSSTRLPHNILYKTYINNKDKFSAKNSAIIERFILNKITEEQNDILCNLTRNSLNASVRYLYMKLEQLHYNINDIFEDSIDIDMVKNVINNTNGRIGSDQKRLLELKYGINGENEHTIIELADMYETDYTTMHDRLRKIRIQVVKEYLDIQGRSLLIDKEIYKSMINNPNYEFTLETRDVLRKYIILGYSYEQISLENKITKTRVSNIITEGIRKLDMYRYNILPSYNITKSDIDKYCLEHNINEEKRMVLYERFVSGVNSRGLQKNQDCIRIISKFMSSYDKLISKETVLIEDYLYEINSHITDSVLDKEQMQFISDYYGIKCKYNISGIRLTKEEIKKKYNINDSKVTTIVSNINLLIRKRKVGILLPRYGIIKREELIEILADKNLPISDREREILYYIKEINGYSLLDELSLSKMYNMAVASLYRRYQRIMLTIKKYQNGEIEGVISYENDIVPILKYFSNYDKKILYFMYKENMNCNDIMKKMSLTRDKAFLEMNRVKKNLTAILRNSNLAIKFDFDYADSVVREADLPLYGNKELLIQIYDLVFGNDGCKRMQAPEIAKYLNLSSSYSSINRYIYDVMLAVLKYKDGYRGEKGFSTEQVIQYYNKYSDSMSAVLKRSFQKYINNLKRTNVKLSSDIKYALLCENEDLVFSFDKTSREDVIKLLKSPKYNFSNNTKSILKSFYNIPEREFMSSKEKMKILQVCENLYKIKLKKDVKQKRIN